MKNWGLIVVLVVVLGVAVFRDSTNRIMEVMAIHTKTFGVVAKINHELLESVIELEARVDALEKERRVSFTTY